MLLFFGPWHEAVSSIRARGFEISPARDNLFCVCFLQPPFPLHSQPGCTQRGSSKDLSTEQVGHRGSAVEPARQLRVLLCSFGEFTQLEDVTHQLSRSFMGELLHTWKTVRSWYRQVMLQDQVLIHLLPVRYLVWWLSVIGPSRCL